MFTRVSLWRWTVQNPCVGPALDRTWTIDLIGCKRKQAVAFAWDSQLLDRPRSQGLIPSPPLWYLLSFFFSRNCPISYPMLSLPWYVLSFCFHLLKFKTLGLGGWPVSSWRLVSITTQRFVTVSLSRNAPLS